METSTMNVYLITYDLRQPGRDYRSLHAAIRSYGNHLHPLESTWFIASNLDAAAIRNDLARHVDINDGLLVLKCAQVAAWQGLSNSDSAVLKATLEAVR
jgi:hypothetical protein